MSGHNLSYQDLGTTYAISGLSQLDQGTWKV